MPSLNSKKITLSHWYMCNNVTLNLPKRNCITLTKKNTILIVFTLTTIPELIQFTISELFFYCRTKLKSHVNKIVSKVFNTPSFIKR